MKRLRQNKKSYSKTKKPRQNKKDTAKQKSCSKIKISQQNGKSGWKYFTIFITSVALRKKNYITAFNYREHEQVVIQVTFSKNICLRERKYRKERKYLIDHYLTFLQNKC